VEGGIASRAQRIFNDTTVMGTCHYTFLETHRMYTIKSESSCQIIVCDNVNVHTLMYISCVECSQGETVGQRVLKNSVTFNFAVDLELL
jgi:hypothetical protein